MKPHCVSLEMAKRLKDAGFPQDQSYFCWYRLHTGKYFLWNRDEDDKVNTCYAAPTVGELGEMLPHLVYTYTTEDMRNEADARAEMWLYLNKEE